MSLSGQLGPDAATFRKLIQSAWGRYLPGAGLRWTPFDFGANGLGVAAGATRALTSQAGYELTASGALQDTECAFRG